MEKIKNKEIVKTVIMLAIIVIGTVGFVFGLKTALKIDFPLMVVMSESMIPTINVGDIILIRGGLNSSEITAAPAPIGDIIVFRKPGDPDNFIVHRAIDRNTLGFETKGDNAETNPYPDPWQVPEQNIIGRVIGRIPMLGYLFLFLRTPIGLLLFISLVILFLFQDLVLPKSK